MMFLTSGEVTTYYFAGSQRVAMRKNGGAPTWFIADHLGSTSLALDNNGNEVAGTREKYYPFGETRVKATLNGVTTAYIGNYYEQSGAAYKKYYYAGAQRIAVNDNGTLYWLLGDHPRLRGGRLWAARL